MIFMCVDIHSYVLKEISVNKMSGNIFVTLETLLDERVFFFCY